MRWRPPQHKDVRIVKKFAFFPIKIASDDVRWWEFVYVKQYYIEVIKSPQRTEGNKHFPNLYKDEWVDRMSPYVGKKEYLEYIGKTNIIPEFKVTSTMPKCKRPPAPKGSCGGKCMCDGPTKPNPPENEKVKTLG